MRPGAPASFLGGVGAIVEDVVAAVEAAGWDGQVDVVDGEGSPYRLTSPRALTAGADVDPGAVARSRVAAINASTSYVCAGEASR